MAVKRETSLEGISKYESRKASEIATLRAQLCLANQGTVSVMGRVSGESQVRQAPSQCPSACSSKFRVSREIKEFSQSPGR